MGHDGLVPDPPRLIEALLAAAHLVVPDAIPGLINRHAKRLRADLAVLYLVGLDQCTLIPLPDADGAVLQDVGIDGTLAGRSYRTLDVVDTVDHTVAHVIVPGQRQRGDNRCADDCAWALLTAEARRTAATHPASSWSTSAP